ncbi:amidohydrolase family protein [Devosia sp.]|uniref:amidohydrolase family protein n=1 Tax=Devosia sp. TaxID=1871048 RepID=UPI003A902211
MIKIVDPHIHLWDLWTRIYPHFETPGPGGANAAICRSYMIEEYLEEGRDAFEIVGAVHVEAFPTDPIKETETLQNVADANPLPLVIVGNGDLTATDFPDLLDRHQEHAIFRGIRQVVNMHPDPKRSYVTRDLMAEPQFLEGLRELGRRGLSFDLQLYPHQMEQAAQLAAAAPDTLIILNHAGMWADRDLTGWQHWKAGMRTLAAQPNIVAKISGLAMLDNHWTIDSIRPLVFESLEAFGTERAMFASNFPVDKLHRDFVSVWQAFDVVTRAFSETERAGLFRDNARKYYRLPG